MYRTTVDGKDVIIKLSNVLGKTIVDRASIYHSVISVIQKVLPREEQCNFAVHNKEIGLIIGEVQRGDVVVFSVEHIIEKQNIFQQHIFDQTFEQRANF